MYQGIRNQGVGSLLAGLIILFILSAVAISGCGQKGPLYRPDVQQALGNPIE